MKTRDFNKYLKEGKENQLKSDYMCGKVYLTDKQLERICEKNDGHSGCSFNYSKESKEDKINYAEKVSKITMMEYEEDDYEAMVEDLLDVINHKDEEMQEYKQHIQDNYKEISKENPYE